MTPTTLNKVSSLKGGEFLLKQSEHSNTFTIENLTEEQKMFRDMTRDFIETKVLPHVQKIDKKDYDLVAKLLEEAGELGLLGASVPEVYGGMGADLVTEMILGEEIGPSHSYSVAYAAHTGIGTLPVLYFGNEEQKKKFLPGLASGAIKAAYCLTEPGSGSDSLAAKTKATLTEDGEHFLITGQKMWITNSGFANLFTVFAQVEADDRLDGKSGFTGFLIEADRENVSLGGEEDKMGIKGSSTRQVFLEGVKIPKENLLGEIGKGHKIAFGVLNIGRLKLGVMCLGGCKAASNRSVKYANERIQFGVPISSFGAIQYKLAEQATRIFVAEAALYRTTGMVSDRIDALVEEGMDKVMAKKQAAEEYAIECAILKVVGSEVLDYCVDESVQIFGGNGFSEEFPAARAFRDARINRIFEGTNEINRLLSVSMLLKKAMKGTLDIMTPVMSLSQTIPELLKYRPDFENLKAAYALEKEVVGNLKKALLLITGAAFQKYQNELHKQQQVVMNLSDMLIEVFMVESAVLRGEKIFAQDKDSDAIQMALVKTYCSDAIERFYLHGKHALLGFAEGDNQKALLKVLKNLTTYELYNTTEARKKIAAQLIEKNGYAF